MQRGANPVAALFQLMARSTFAKNFFAGRCISINGCGGDGRWAIGGRSGLFVIHGEDQPRGDWYGTGDARQIGQFPSACLHPHLAPHLRCSGTPCPFVDTNTEVSDNLATNISASNSTSVPTSDRDGFGVNNCRSTNGQFSNVLHVKLG